jgi:Holliday junction resolvasome RuvABC ATP-dependent DNA helicase subunit
MINSIKSTYSQLEKLEKYLDANTDRLFITTDTYSALMDIRERLKGEIAQYEREQKRVSNPLIQKRIRDEKDRWAKKLKEWFF